jgi:hypothetical protein
MADVIDLKTRGLVRPVTMAATERRARAARRRIRNAATLLSNRANFLRMARTRLPNQWRGHGVAVAGFRAAGRRRQEHRREGMTNRGGGRRWPPVVVRGSVAECTHRARLAVLVALASPRRFLPGRPICKVGLRNSGVKHEGYAGIYAHHWRGCRRRCHIGRGAEVSRCMVRSRDSRRLLISPALTGGAFYSGLTTASAPPLLGHRRVGNARSRLEVDSDECLHRSQQSRLPIFRRAPCWRRRGSFAVHRNLGRGIAGCPAGCRS